MRSGFTGLQPIAITKAICSRFDFFHISEPNWCSVHSSRHPKRCWPLELTLPSSWIIWWCAAEEGCELNASDNLIWNLSWVTWMSAATWVRWSGRHLIDRLKPPFLQTVSILSFLQCLQDHTLLLYYVPCQDCPWFKLPYQITKIKLVVQLLYQCNYDEYEVNYDSASTRWSLKAWSQAIPHCIPEEYNTRLNWHCDGLDGIESQLTTRSHWNQKHRLVRFSSVSLVCQTQKCEPSLRKSMQLPLDMGGREGKALSIDTENTFRPQRL